MKIFSSHKNISDKKFREFCSSKPSSLACLPLLMHIPWLSRCQAFAVISLSSGLSSGGHIRRGTLKAVTYLLTGELWFSGPRDQGFGVGPLQYFKVNSHACMRCLHQTRPSSNPVDNCHFSFWSECTTVSNHWFFVELILESYEI